MAKTKKNRHIGEGLSDYVRRRRAADPDYARLHDEQFDKVQLARRIRALRQTQKLSQNDLAEVTGTTQSAIARLESGRFAPRLDVLQRVARALGKRLDVRLIPVPQS